MREGVEELYESVLREMLEEIDFWPLEDCLFFVFKIEKPAGRRWEQG